MKLVEATNKLLFLCLSQKSKGNEFLPENSFLNLLYIKPETRDTAKAPKNV